MGKASKLSIVPSSPWEIDPDVIKREKFSSWRKYQRETVEAVLKSEKPFVLLSAPTGSGKSLIAVSLGLLLIQSEEDKYEPDAEKIEVVLSKTSAEEIIQILS